MKLAFFDDFKLGVVAGDKVVDVTDVVKDIPRLGPQDVMRGVIERFDALKDRLVDAAAKGHSKPVSQVRLRPPLLKPENIICMAVNYMEDGTLPEPAPMNAFMKSPSAIIGDGDTMILPDMAATIFEGEAELAVVIGKRASHVKGADAMGYVFGYTNFIDGSARGVVPTSQKRNRQIHQEDEPNEFEHKYGPNHHWGPHAGIAFRGEPVRLARMMLARKGRFSMCDGASWSPCSAAGWRRCRNDYFIGPQLGGPRPWPIELDRDPTVSERALGPATLSSAVQKLGPLSIKFRLLARLFINH